MVAATDTGQSYGRCIGRAYTAGTSCKSGCYSTNQDLSEFTLISSQTNYLTLSRILSDLGISNFSECKNIYYVSCFKQTTYDGDLLIKPFIYGGMMNSSGTLASESVMGKGITGIGNETADMTDNGFCYLYPTSLKGQIVRKVSKLSEEQRASLNALAENFPGNRKFFFLCKAFKTDESTDTTKATAYYGGYLLFEI